MQQGSNSGCGAAWMLLVALGGFAFAGVVFCAETARFWPDTAWGICFIFAPEKVNRSRPNLWPRRTYEASDIEWGKGKLIRPL